MAQRVQRQPPWPFQPGPTHRQPKGRADMAVVEAATSAGDKHQVAAAASSCLSPVLGQQVHDRLGQDHFPLAPWGLELPRQPVTPELLAHAQGGHAAPYHPPLWAWKNLLGRRSLL